MSTSSYLCLHVSVCARRGVETNPLRDIICYQRQRYLYPGFSPPARSISLQPPSRSISFSISHFITLSYPFFSPCLSPVSPRHVCTLSASPSIRGPSQGRSGAISVRLIHFLLITQPLSEQENTRLSLRLRLSQIVHLFPWANRINGEENWSNHSFCMGQQACRSAGVGTMTCPWSPAQLLWSVFPEEVFFNISIFKNKL